MSELELYRPATGLSTDVLDAHLRAIAEINNDPCDVGVIMGSGSDLPAIKPALDLLTSKGISYEARIVSAHRTPEWMAAYGHSAAQRDLRLIIAIAGGSAHLPGDMASHTSLPVIGVAREDLLDMQNAALGSMLEMPPEGGPLGVAGRVTLVNNSGAVNAANYTAKILGINEHNSSEADGVGVIVDSESDVRWVEPAIDILDVFAIPYEVKVQSNYGHGFERHASQEMKDYSSEAISNNVRVIIAMASSYSSVVRLQDMAAESEVPIIGVANEVRNRVVLSTMLTSLEDGSGVPVTGKVTEHSSAGSVNAGLYAARILATGTPALRSYIEQRMAAKALGVLEDDRLLSEVGVDEFMRIKNLRTRVTDIGALLAGARENSRD